jgi:hypothetical protein
MIHNSGSVESLFFIRESFLVIREGDPLPPPVFNFLGSVEILCFSLSGNCEGDPLSPPKGDVAQGGKPP